ncbi:hypothetical protein ACJJTC_007703 [Scirpophaga incertulas]
MSHKKSRVKVLSLEVLRRASAYDNLIKVYLRSGRDSYGDNAVGYVQVKTENGICTVMARITPEHRVRATAYRCTFVCNEISNKIESVECEGCAASRGGCKHTMALVMWLHRRSEQPACTEIACYWIKPKLSQIGSQLKFIKAKDMGSKKKSLLGIINTFMFRQLKHKFFTVRNRKVYRTGNRFSNYGLFSSN